VSAAASAKRSQEESNAQDLEDLMSQIGGN
jgi:hypothetical protein